MLKLCLGHRATYGPSGFRGLFSNHYVVVLCCLLDLGRSCQTFGCLRNRKPGLRLESGRIFEMDELVFCLPEKKWCTGSTLLPEAALPPEATLAPGICPAEPVRTSE